MSRYQMWAGGSHPDIFAAIFGKTAIPEVETVWPIVDTKTCGVIHGEPTLSQIFCFTLGNKEQQIVCDALNKQENGHPKGEE